MYNFPLPCVWLSWTSQFVIPPKTSLSCVFVFCALTFFCIELKTIILLH